VQVLVTTSSPVPLERCAARTLAVYTACWPYTQRAILQAADPVAAAYLAVREGRLEEAVVVLLQHQPSADQGLLCTACR